MTPAAEHMATWSCPESSAIRNEKDSTEQGSAAQCGKAQHCTARFGKVYVYVCLLMIEGQTLDEPGFVLCAGCCRPCNNLALQLHCLPRPAAAFLHARNTGPPTSLESLLPLLVADVPA
jgi:hypothetical protein